MSAYDSVQRDVQLTSGSQQMLLKATFPGGNRFVTVDDDRVMRLWDARMTESNSNRHAAIHAESSGVLR